MVFRNLQLLSFAPVGFDVAVVLSFVLLMEAQGVAFSVVWCDQFLGEIFAGKRLGSPNTFPGLASPKNEGRISQFILREAMRPRGTLERIRGTSPVACFPRMEGMRASLGS